MKRLIKEIDSPKTKIDNCHFDIVDLEDIFRRKPKDHHQFAHHKISFYVIIIITDKKGKHSINYRDYTYDKGTVFTLRKDNIHKFYKTNAKGKFLIFTEDFIARYTDKIEILKPFQLFNEILGTPKLQLNKSDYDEIENLIYQIEKECVGVKDNFSSEITRCLIQVLLHKLFRLKSHGSNNLENKNYYLKFIALQELVEKECFKSKKVSYYANKMGVTPRTLNNTTQSIIGKHAKSFIDDIVILQIKKLLINSKLSFTKIA